MDLFSIACSHILKCEINGTVDILLFFFKEQIHFHTWHAIKHQKQNI